MLVYLISVNITISHFTYKCYDAGNPMNIGKWVTLFTHSPTEGGQKNVLHMLKVMTKL